MQTVVCASFKSSVLLSGDQKPLHFFFHVTLCLARGRGFKRFRYCGYFPHVPDCRPKTDGKYITRRPITNTSPSRLALPVCLRGMSYITCRLQYSHFWRREVIFRLKYSHLIPFFFFYFFTFDLSTHLSMFSLFFVYSFSLFTFVFACLFASFRSLVQRFSASLISTIHYFLICRS